MPREVGPWTKDKLRILELYLSPYLTATQRAIERVYIDAFAGPGTNIVDRTEEIIDGSPLIALSAIGRGKIRGFDRLFFIEENYDLYLELRDTVEERGQGHRTTVIHGDANVELPRVLRQINRRSPTFVFLDPEGIDPNWEAVESLAEWQTELLINFPLGMAINRNPDSAKTEAYFGTPEWRYLWESGRLSRTSGLIHLYLRRLAELGWEHQVHDSRLIRDEGNRNLYYLLFASKVTPARNIMNWVFRQPDSSGQGRLPL